MQNPEYLEHVKLISDKILIWYRTIILGYNWFFTKYFIKLNVDIQISDYMIIIKFQINDKLLLKNDDFDLNSAYLKKYAYVSILFIISYWKGI